MPHKLTYVKYRTIYSFASHGEQDNLHAFPRTVGEEASISRRLLGHCDAFFPLIDWTTEAPRVQLLQLPFIKQKNTFTILTDPSNRCSETEEKFIPFTHGAPIKNMTLYEKKTHTSIHLTTEFKSLELIQHLSHSVLGRCLYHKHFEAYPYAIFLVTTLRVLRNDL